MILYDVIWVLSFGYIWQSIDQLGLTWHVTSYDKPASLSTTSMALTSNWTIDTAITFLSFSQTSSWPFGTWAYSQHTVLPTALERHNCPNPLDLLHDGSAWWTLPYRFGLGRWTWWSPVIRTNAGSWLQSWSCWRCQRANGFVRCRTTSTTQSKELRDWFSSTQDQDWSLKVQTEDQKSGPRRQPAEKAWLPQHRITTPLTAKEQ